MLSNYTSVFISYRLMFLQQDRTINRDGLALSHNIKQHIYQVLFHTLSLTHTHFGGIHYYNEADFKTVSSVKMVEVDLTEGGCQV